MRKTSDLVRSGMGYHRAAKAVLAERLDAARGSPLYDTLVAEAVSRLRGELQRACAKYPGLAARLAGGASQHDAAAVCGCSRSRVSGIVERAKRIVQLRGKGSWTRELVNADRDSTPR